MRHRSERRRRLLESARPVRDGLIAEVKQCEICGHGPRHRRPGPEELSLLCCHEIACGSLRKKALGCRWALLVLCWYCNGMLTDKREWPEAKQLAVLKRRRPGDYDLAAYNDIVNPRAPQRITEDEVSRWRMY